MARYKIITLVDITRSQPAKDESDSVKIGQQANFHSVIQAIGLRSNIEWDSDPKRFNGRLPEPAEGKSVYWVWEFNCEREDVFLKNNDPVALLLEDLQGVPIVSRLTNSTDIDPAAIQTIGEQVNTWVQIL